MEFRFAGMIKPGRQRRQRRTNRDGRFGHNKLLSFGCNSAYCVSRPFLPAMALSPAPHPDEIGASIRVFVPPRADLTTKCKKSFDMGKPMARSAFGERLSLSVAPRVISQGPDLSNIRSSSNAQPVR